MKEHLRKRACRISSNICSSRERYRRSAADIAEEIDSVGGNLNAFTSKECTCFYVKVLEENLPAALDILADLVCNSKLTPDDIEREKGVVLEEIAMNEDSPEDLAHEELCKAYYSGDRLAMPFSAMRRVSVRSRGTR